MKRLMQMKKARELDPLSTRINADLGMAYLAAGRYDEAIGQEQKTLELNPKAAGALLDTWHGLPAKKNV